MHNRNFDRSFFVVAAALAALLIPATFAQAGNLLGLYQFEGNLNDSSGNSAHGFNANNVTFNGAGYQGQAGQFNGSSSFFDIPVNIDIATRPRATIGAWVNADVVNSFSRQEIISSDNGGFDRTLTIDSRNTGGGEAGAPTYSAFNGSGALLTGSAASAADGYVFIAAAYNQATSTTNLYVGPNKFSESGAVDNSQTFLRVGTHASGAPEFFGGQIDNVFAFDGVLTDGQIAKIRTGGVAGINAVNAAGTLWSVDIHGSGTPALMTGVEPSYGYGNVWNGFTVAHHAGVSTNPSSGPLVESNGAATGVAFAINGSVSGFNNAGDPLAGDYLFINAGGASPNITWTISGLVPGGLYEMVNYSGNIGGRDFNMAVDLNGNGSLADDTSLNVNTSRIFSDIIASSSGTIIGNATNAGHEGNWAGFQLRYLATPEPSSLVLASLGVAALALVARRRGADRR